jgi:GST-like protein
MLKFYFNGSPNPTKVALFLEEAGLAYEPIPVDTRKGDQFAPEFLKVNPNGKVPAIQDGDVTVFDSNAILLYLAEKTGKFLPPTAARGELLSWLMFVASGIGPFNGQAVHFKHFATEKVAYAHNRYQFEADRHFGVVEQRLASRPYMVGGVYTIVDMALWGWSRMIPFVLGEAAWEKFPNVKRLNDEIAARPAAVRAIALKDQFPFKVTMDDEARAVMFKHLARG